MKRSLLSVAVALLIGIVFALTSASANSVEEEQLAKMVTQRHCASCHTFAQGKPRGQGPNLHALIGREAGVETGFPYSPEFTKALAGRVWTIELLDEWLIDSQVVAPGNGMTYFQDDEQIRQLIIDCLRTSCAADAAAP